MEVGYSLAWAHVLPLGHGDVFISAKKSHRQVALSFNSISLDQTSRTYT